MSMQLLSIIENSRLSIPDFFVPTSISWHNIDVWTNCDDRVNKKTKDFVQKEILTKVSGVCKAGQLLAVMGPIGAGKTTLLNVLNARNLSKVMVKGVVKLNGQLANAKSIASVSAYVQQEDLFIPVLTVREHLLFQVTLRLDQNMTKDERQTRVELAMTEFSLTKCADTYIGSISGGESKQLAFASEMLTNPSIILCDEPTTGLDYNMAENVVNIMKAMTLNGRTVICTIHQPSSQVFQLFEQLLLLADGRVAYMGEREKAINFFITQGIVFPQMFNPSYFFINELTIIPGKETESKQLIQIICDNYLKSSHSDVIKDMDNNRCSFPLPSSFDEEKTDDITHVYNANIWQQFCCLLRRSFISNIRDPEFKRLILVQPLTAGIFLGQAYYHNKVKGDQMTMSDAQSMSLMIFLMVLILSLLCSQSTIPVFTSKLPLYMQEHYKHTYRIDIYYITTILIGIPQLTIIPIISCSIYYFMVGLNPGSFLVHLVLMILMMRSFASLGSFIACKIDTLGRARLVYALTIGIMTLFSGCFLNLVTMPAWISWLRYFSLFFYSYEALMINQWSSIGNLTCTGTVANATSTSDICLTDGTTVIDYYGFDENDLTRNIILLIFLSIIGQILALIILLFKARKGHFSLFKYVQDKIRMR